jgi:hypothetical protein
MERSYIVIYKDNTHTIPLTKEEAVGVFEVYEADYLLKIERINPKRNATR